MPSRLHISHKGVCFDGLQPLTIAMDSTALGSSEPPLYNAALLGYEQRYLSLLRTIASLQWVRESLPAHTRYYQSLKNKLKNEEITSNLLEADV